MPKVSVILPVYGVEDYIEACLESLVRQTFRDFELILVDDGAIDRSIERAVAYLKTTNTNWSILTQKNQGQGSARDAGIRAATGKFVICVDPDDTVSPRFLEALYTEADAWGRDLCFTGYQMTELPKTDWGPAAPAFRTVGRDALMSAFLCRGLAPILPSMIIRRDIILRWDISVYPGCRFSEDVYLMWLLFSVSRNVSYTNEPLYSYLRRPGSTMTASSAARILTGYPAFQALSRDSRLEDFPLRRYLLPRWVLGALRSSARIFAYPDFLRIAEAMDFPATAKGLTGFPEWKGRLLAALLRIHPRLFYQVIRIAG